MSPSFDFAQDIREKPFARPGPGRAGEALEGTNGSLSLRLRLRPSLWLVRAYGSERGASAPEGEPLARRGQALSKHRKWLFVTGSNII
jgi:hypothetical protein